MSGLTVLMAVYNGERFLQPAVDSILRQTYSDFRFLVMDDASTDSTPELLRRVKDPRLEVVRLEKNVGQTAALNLGLRRVSTAYIARMDADDYSAPERLERQMSRLREETALDCVGTHAWEFSDDPSVRMSIIRRPESYPEVRKAALHGAGVIHGTILIRREALLEIGGYDERYRYASDRDMFIRLLPKHRAVNLPQPLLGIRRHPGQDSFSKIAADEYIDIFERLIMEDGYGEVEQPSVLRGNLAYSYLFRANYFRKNRRYGEWAADWLRAVRLSPKTCGRSMLGTAAKRLLPEQLLGSLRKGYLRPA